MNNTKTKTETGAKVRHLPPHGPIDENGREVLLSIRNVDITFGKGDSAVRAVKDASFDIYKGETFSLVGESGSGKTTIGRAVIRVNPCAAGEILYKGVPITGKIPHSLDREVIRNIQMVFQDPAASLNERATVDYIVSEGLYNFHLFKNEADRVEKVRNMITEVGLLPEHLTRYPHEFSGGQRQRIGLARAMVMEPELVVADEPISALDVSIRAQVLNLLKKFQQERDVTYLFIAHDLSIVRFISDRIGVIYKGNIVEIAAAEELFNYPLHPYTRSLISAIPIPDPQLEKNKVLFTYDPSVHDYSVDKPVMTDIGHNHFVYGSAKEIEEYKAIREKGVPIKSITIRDADAPEEEPVEEPVDTSAILSAPIHDTGNIWYTFFSLLLPIIGIIAAVLFRKKNYIKNYRACVKGAKAGFIIIGAIIALFLILLLLAVVL
ncbi:ATP-binding cassette domain-containing protein [Acutalibacter intestini]|uniref:ATP-binding cassette domain-containing protein n=1 Tax=Acutalibacter intestini TaxID=3093659 RepID=UPI002AC90318|nr:ATP-binding cassette domain-containing protein [Acutalibacter sp. M00204]